jgi:hypothetical protein
MACAASPRANRDRDPGQSSIRIGKGGACGLKIGPCGIDVGSGSPGRLPRDVELGLGGGDGGPKGAVVEPDENVAGRDRRAFGCGYLDDPRGNLRRDCQDIGLNVGIIR